jgi:hypothetical protein
VEEYAVAMENFPYEIVETSGEDALATWEKLKNAGRGTPVVLGSGIEKYLPTPAQRAQLPTVQDILAVAATINFPDDFFKVSSRRTRSGYCAPQRDEPADWPRR